MIQKYLYLVWSNFRNSYNLVTNIKYIFFIKIVCANTISVTKYYKSEVIPLCLTDFSSLNFSNSFLNPILLWCPQLSYNNGFQSLILLSVKTYFLLCVFKLLITSVNFPYFFVLQGAINNHFLLIFFPSTAAHRLLLSPLCHHFSRLANPGLYASGTAVFVIKTNMILNLCNLNNSRCTSHLED